MLITSLAIVSRSILPTKKNEEDVSFKFVLLGYVLIQILQILGYFYPLDIVGHSSETQL